MSEHAQAPADLSHDREARSRRWMPTLAAGPAGGASRGVGWPVMPDRTASWAWRHPPGAVRRVACVWALVSVGAVILILTWLLTWLLAGVQTFWPAWALLGLGTA